MRHDMIGTTGTRADAATPARNVKEFAVVKRSVVVGGHKTSVSLEDAFWVSLREIASRRGLTLSTQIDTIDRDRRTGNLSSAIRLFVLDHFRTRAVTSMFIGERQSSPAISTAR
jgi:predicted DNA-binding ribbon-helix-helix protein